MSSPNIPNLLIVGAAKAGTTSIHHYISKHENVLMSDPKEPKYFFYNNVKIGFKGAGDALIQKQIVKDFDSYLGMYSSNDSNSFSIFGDSSADNLYYYEDVIPSIKEVLGDPKIIICLRNPIERAFSAYCHLLREGRETLTFDRALMLEEQRIKEGYEFIWHYKSVGQYYKQVSSFIDNFSNVKIVLFEDIKADSQSVIKEIFEFLSIPNVSIDTSKVHNQSGVSSNKIASFFYRFLRSESVLKSFGKKLIPVNWRESFRSKVKSEFNKSLVKPILDTTTKNELIEFYRDDILELQNLIKRDLSKWLK